MGTPPGPLEDEVQIFADGERLVTLGSGATGIIWAASSGEELQRLSLLPGVHFHRAVRLAPDGERVVTGVSYHWDDPVVVWSVADGGSLVEVRQPADWVRSLAISPCGARLVTAALGTIFLWDARTGQQLHRLEGQLAVISSIAVSEGGRRVLGGSRGLQRRTERVSSDAPRSSKSTGHSTQIGGGPNMLHVCS